MNKIIAVDFDGTLCENEYPNIGAPRTDVISKLKAEALNGAKIILWTCREGSELEKALDFCRQQGIYFDAVNANLPEAIDAWKNDCRKIGADEYWDDKAVRV